MTSLTRIPGYSTRRLREKTSTTRSSSRLHPVLRTRPGTRRLLRARIPKHRESTRTKQMLDKRKSMSLVL